MATKRTKKVSQDPPKRAPSFDSLDPELIYAWPITLADGLDRASALAATDVIKFALTRCEQAGLVDTDVAEYAVNEIRLALLGDEQARSSLFKPGLGDETARELERVRTEIHADNRRMKRRARGVPLTEWTDVNGIAWNSPHYRDAWRTTLYAIGNLRWLAKTALDSYRPGRVTNSALHATLNSAAVVLGELGDSNAAAINQIREIFAAARERYRAVTPRPTLTKTEIALARVDEIRRAKALGLRPNRPNKRQRGR